MVEEIQRRRDDSSACGTGGEGKELGDELGLTCPLSLEGALESDIVRYVVVG